jgi:hypothetical protein
MEAELQRAKRDAGRPATELAEGEDPARRVNELMHAISELSDALTELRDLVSPPGGPSRAGYGFVLPPRGGGGPAARAA